MDTATAAAARAARARALECHARCTQLAAGRRVVAEDVRRAETALARALERAEQAHVRLEHTLARPVRALPATLGSHHCWTASVNVEQLRRHARQLDQEELFTNYFALGGPADRWDLDAFVHAGLDLPADRLTILAHAVWELTELS